MATCVHFPKVVSKTFDTCCISTSKTQPHALSKTLSLSFFPSLSLSLPSGSPSLSLSVPLSLSLSLSPFLALPLLFPLPLSSPLLSLLPLLSSVCRQGKSCKKQIRRWVKTRMPPEKSTCEHCERCLKRCSSIPGAIPQISRNRQTPQTWREDGSCFRTLKSMVKSIQNSL